jgi:2-polyprenyl-6-methoxyphenol hydroxylase-like FAD-dependent oxidoreductase
VPEGDRKNDRVKHLHGHKVTGIEEKGDKILVQYETSDAEKGAMEADLVIGADGPSSTVRSLLMPGVERTYAGYVALRGTVLKEEASPEAQKVFSERFVFHHQTGIQILAYLIPGANGTLEPGKRLINFVYYTKRRLAFTNRAIPRVPRTHDRRRRPLPPHHHAAGQIRPQSLGKAV